ncbi:MAG: hypothetical protein IJ785_06500 [Bacteroidales bacterium]|nr:hypothetical protein [Bacteroidales bacterium]
MNKKTKWWIAPLMMCLLAANASAQGDIEVLQFCPSYVWHYPDIKETTNSLVCGNSNFRVILAQYKNPAKGINLHTFIIKDYYTGTESYHTTYFNAIDSTDYNINITDMEMFGGECYFCGTATYAYLESYNSPILHSEGFIGHFSPQAVQSGSGSIVFKSLNTIRSLSQLTVTNNPGVPTIVYATGTYGSSSQGCLLEVYNTIGSGWHYNLDIVNSTPNILFSDVIASLDSITLLATLDCQNDFADPSSPTYDPNHQVFLIDRSSRKGFFYDYHLSSFHYMAHYYLNTDPGYNFHYNLAPLRLYLTDYYDNTFGAAFCARDVPSTMGAVRLFSFPHKMSYSKSIYYKTGKYASIVDIGTWEYGSYNPFILSADNTNTNALLTCPNWNDPNETVTFCSSQDYKLRSLAQYRNMHGIDIPCHMGADKLGLIYQSIDSIHISCLDNVTKHFATFPEKQAALMVVEWGFPFSNREISFGAAELIDQKEITPENLCTTCNNQN